MKNRDKLIAVVEKIALKENKSPETVVSELNNMSEEQINNKLKMINIFKDGGKLDYLLCLKKGGSVKDCGCGGNVEKKAEGGVTEESKIIIQPSTASNSLIAKIMENLKIAPRTTIDGVEYSAVELPDGRIRQNAYGDDYTSTLKISPQQDSVITRINDVGMKRVWSNIPGSKNTMSKELAIAPFKRVTVKK